MAPAKTVIRCRAAQRRLRRIQQHQTTTTRQFTAARGTWNRTPPAASRPPGPNKSYERADGGPPGRPPPPRRCWAVVTAGPALWRQPPPRQASGSVGRRAAETRRAAPRSRISEEPRQPEPARECDHPSIMPDASLLPSAPVRHPYAALIQRPVGSGWVSSARRSGAGLRAGSAPPSARAAARAGRDGCGCR